MISTYQSTPLYRNEEFLRDRYLKKRLSTGQIAREIRSARSTVLEGLKRFGISMRPEDEAHQLNKVQLAYGGKMVNGKITAHKGELAMLRNMASLRAYGQSYWKLAEQLNLD